MGEIMIPLHIAVLNKEYSSVACLCEQGANVNAQTFNGETAMHLAIRMNDLVMVKLLALSGANINLRNAVGQNSVSFPLNENYIDVLQDFYIQRSNLEKTFPIDNEFINGQSLCHLAVQYGYIDVIQKLIENRYPINRINYKKETPLHIAVQKGNLQIMDLLINAGARLDTKDIYGQTPLHHAAQYNNLDAVIFLCQRGADLYAEDSNGANLTHIAAQYHALGILKWAHQEQNLDMDYLDDNGDLPIHYAARNGEVQIIEYLHKLKLNINAINFYDETPLFMATSQGHINVIEYFHKKIGLDLNSCIHDGNYLVHVAVHEDHITLVKWLIQKGVDMNVQNSDGNTPLHLAIMYKNLEMMSLLKDNGADVNIKNEHNETALTCALANEVDASLFCTPEIELDLSDKSIYDYLIKNIDYILSRNKLQEKILVGFNILKAFEGLEYSYYVKGFTENLTKNLVQIVEGVIRNILKIHTKDNLSNIIERKIRMQELKETLKQAIDYGVKSVALNDALYEGMLTISAVFCLKKLAKRGDTYDCWSELGGSVNSTSSSRDFWEDSKANKPHKVQKFWNKGTDSVHTFDESDSSTTTGRYSDANLYLTVDSMGKIDAES